MGGRRPFALVGAFTLRLGRRNLHPDAFTLLLGRRYNRAKKQGERTDITSGKSCQKSTTAERLAKEHGVTEKTVRNAGKFAESVEKAKAIDPETARGTLSVAGWRRRASGLGSRTTRRPRRRGSRRRMNPVDVYRI